MCDRELAIWLDGEWHFFPEFFEPISPIAFQSDIDKAVKMIKDGLEAKKELEKYIKEDEKV